MAKPLPPINALYAFEAAARYLSITRAADELNVTPSAVSHRIRGLETRLGVALFHRNRRHLMLSDAGQRLYPGIRDGFGRIAVALADLDGLQQRGILTVSMLSTFASRWFIPRLPRFQQAHPDIEVHISTTMRPVSFERDGVDAAIRYGGGDWPDLHADRLLGEEITPVCHPDLIAGDPPLREIADLAHHTLLHAEARPEDWPLWLKMQGYERLKPAQTVTFDSTNFTLEAAQQGAGVAIAAMEFVADALVDQRLAIPFGRPVQQDQAYYLVCPTGWADRPKIAALRTWLVQEVAAAR
jgi:LysR family glycine cleavage system transcriptional activator